MTSELLDKIIRFSGSEKLLYFQNSVLFTDEPQKHLRGGNVENKSMIDEQYERTMTAKLLEKQFIEEIRS